MDFNDVINNRREITSFLDQSISNEKLESILEAAWLAPTGNNLPSREFIVVKDKEVLLNLSRTTPYVPWLKEANCAVVITGRPEISKYWIQDGSIAAGYIWLSAVNAEIGCAFGAVFNAMDEKESGEREAFVKEELHIPKDRRVLAILGLGYAKDKPNKKKLPKKTEMIHYETFEKVNNS